jgi:hypothetical protein
VPEPPFCPQTPHPSGFEEIEKACDCDCHPSSIPTWCASESPAPGSPCSGLSTEIRHLLCAECSQFPRSGAVLDAPIVLLGMSDTVKPLNVHALLELLLEATPALPGRAGRSVPAGWRLHQQRPHQRCPGRGWSEVAAGPRRVRQKRHTHVSRRVARRLQAASLPRLQPCWSVA